MQVEAKSSQSAKASVVAMVATSKPLWRTERGQGETSKGQARHRCPVIFQIRKPAALPSSSELSSVRRAVTPAYLERSERHCGNYGNGPDMEWRGAGILAATAEGGETVMPPRRGKDIRFNRACYIRKWNGAQFF